METEKVMKAEEMAKWKKRYSVGYITDRIASALYSNLPENGHAMIAYIQDRVHRGFLVQYMENTLLICIKRAYVIDFFFREDGINGTYYTNICIPEDYENVQKVYLLYLERKLVWIFKKFFQGELYAEIVTPNKHEMLLVEPMLLDCYWPTSKRFVWVILQEFSTTIRKQILTDARNLLGAELAKEFIGVSTV